ncbi:MAG TPA: PilZ domain-containing protein [Terriglobales bacterium]|nr:PilZ domain-containing protein [Terriglobales bacterium]
MKTIEKRIHLALPIRVYAWDANFRPQTLQACTYDISSQGARIVGLNGQHEPGEILSLERGKNKALFRVVWIGERGSPQQGQIGVESIEPDKPIWETELASLEEEFEAMAEAAAPITGVTKQERRRFPRLDCKGLAELQKTSMAAEAVQASLKNISERGCLVQSPSLFTSGSNIRLALRVSTYELTLKGEIRHAHPERGIGIQFTEIRRGDRPLLQYLIKVLNGEAAALATK